MPEFVDQPKKKKTHFLSLFFTIIYLFLTLAIASLPFIYQKLPVIGPANLDQRLVLAPTVILVTYFLIFAFSFFHRGDNWFIFAIVLLFFSSLGALVLGGIGAINAKNLIHEGIPACVRDLVNCNAGEGVILFSALLLGISIPTLIWNILTFVGIMKSMGANDWWKNFEPQLQNTKPVNR